jgi:hypothetical protein
MCDISKVFRIKPVLLDIFRRQAKSGHFFVGKVQGKTLFSYRRDIGHALPSPGPYFKVGAIRKFPCQFFQKGQVGGQRASFAEGKRTDGFVEIPKHIPGFDLGKSLAQSGNSRMLLPVLIIIQHLIEQPGIFDNLLYSGKGFRDFRHGQVFTGSNLA